MLTPSLLVLWASFYYLVARSPASAQRTVPPSWHQYVRAPSQIAVRPMAVLSQYTTGNVTNAGGLIDGTTTTYLTRAEGSAEVPSIVVDFGQNVVGLLTINFADSDALKTGYPGLKIAFSETLQFLTTRSDFTRSDNAQTVNSPAIWQPYVS